MSSLGPVAAVGVLMLSFMAWLWLYSPDKESEMERWLEDNQLSQLKQHPEFSRGFIFVLLVQTPSINSTVYLNLHSVPLTVDALGECIIELIYISI